MVEEGGSVRTAFPYLGLSGMRRDRDVHRMVALARGSGGRSRRLPLVPSFTSLRCDQSGVPFCGALGELVAPGADYRHPWASAIPQLYVAATRIRLGRISPRPRALVSRIFQRCAATSHSTDPTGGMIPRGASRGFGREGCEARRRHRTTDPPLTRALSPSELPLASRGRVYHEEPPGDLAKTRVGTLRGRERRTGPRLGRLPDSPPVVAPAGTVHSTICVPSIEYHSGGPRTGTALGGAPTHHAAGSKGAACTRCAT